LRGGGGVVDGCRVKFRIVGFCAFT
jgi:hypothetical protein